MALGSFWRHLIELTEHTLEELSDLKYRIYTTSLPNLPSREVLIVAFEGEYGFGCRGNGDATYINVIITAAEAAWQTSFLVLDYRAMTYEWGDMLPLEWGPEETTAETDRVIRLSGGSPKCSAVLVSERNRDSIYSLVNSEEVYASRAGSGVPWLFDDLDAALVAFDDYRQSFLAGQDANL